MKYEIKFTTQFKKDLKLAKRQKRDLGKLFEVISILADGETLDAKYRDHDPNRLSHDEVFGRLRSHFNG